MSSGLNVVFLGDCPAHAFVAVQGSRTEGTLRVVIGPGEAAIHHLRTIGAESPDLFLLDYRVQQAAMETLCVLRGEPSMRHIPVLMLSLGSEREDWPELYRMGANVVYSRPSDPDSYECLVGAIFDHWLTVATLPPSNS
jgi:DNA-binding NarL/FixJ family response regulator